MSSGRCHARRDGDARYDEVAAAARGGEGRGGEQSKALREGVREQEGQAGGGEQDVGGDPRVLEDLALAGADVGAGDEEPDGRPRQPAEIHRGGEHLREHV